MFSNYGVRIQDEGLEMGKEENIMKGFRGSRNHGKF